MLSKRQVFVYFFLSVFSSADGLALPTLEQRGTATQLMISGKPFLMQGVETTNKLLDDPSDLPYLDENLSMYKQAGVNTVLIPITWQSLEPQEGRYDYTMIDALIEGCREHDLKLVVLWFGAIKNGQLSYAPKWVVNDQERFFRAEKPDGTRIFSISPVCEAGLIADKEAFARLMRRVRRKDPNGDVVIMVQPENETGCGALKDERDHCDAADRAWNAAVPAGLLDYLQGNDGELMPWLQRAWEDHGKKTQGTWPEVFGADRSGRWVFMAYYMARFVGQVAEAGQREHNLPMFANDWLGALDKPGGPIGGPDFQVMDIWRYAAPTLFALAPDIYLSPFKKWCAAYDTKDNPLLIPEAGGRHFRSGVSAQCWYAFVQHDAMLFAPYLNIGDEFHPDHTLSDLYFKTTHLRSSYPILKNLADLILQKQGRQPHEMAAFLVDRSDKIGDIYERSVKGVRLKAHSLAGVPDAKDEDKIPPFACVFWMGEGQFLVAGTKMAITFSREGQDMDVEEATLGQYAEGRWILQGPVVVDGHGDTVELRLSTEDVTIEQFW